MKAQVIVIMIAGLFLIGCIWPVKKRFTVALGCHLYDEDFDVNPFGVDECYLTDSQKFRIYVGKYDVEHQAFTFICKGDKVMICRRGEDKDGTWQIFDSLLLSRDDLENGRIDGTKPLFEFK